MSREVNGSVLIPDDDVPRRAVLARSLDPTGPADGTRPRDGRRTAALVLTLLAVGVAGVTLTRAPDPSPLPVVAQPPRPSTGGSVAAAGAPAGAAGPGIASSDWLRADLSAVPASSTSTGDVDLDTAAATATVDTVDTAATVDSVDIVGAELGRLRVRLALTNTGDQPLRITDVTVLGLGTLLLDPAPVGTGRDLAPGASTSLPGWVIADCTARADPVVSVIVAVTRDRANSVIRAAVGPGAGTGSVLDPVCPKPDRALALRVTGARYLTDAGGGLVVIRLVNHGTQSAEVVALAAPDAGPARLVSDPPLPLSLSPGQAVLARIRVTVPGCGTGVAPAPRRSPTATARARPELDLAAMAEALSLEARIPWGFTQVTGFPTADVRRALAAGSGCGLAPRASPPVTP